MIVDAAALYSYFVRGVPDHWRVANEIELRPSEELIVSPISLSTLESRILPAFGRKGWLAVVGELGAGAWSLAALDASHLMRMAPHISAGETLERASALVLAEEYGVELVSGR